jgi:penicillin-binding protein 2
MLIFDQLKRGDAQLRMITLMVMGGLAVLLGGLWWVQIVCANEFRANLETQSFRSIRLPAVRGKILDRGSTALADNRPTYNLNLYLEEMRKLFQQAYSAEILRVRKELAVAADAEQKRLGRKLNASERRKFVLTTERRLEVGRQTRYGVVREYLDRFSKGLQEPLAIDEVRFAKHYQTKLALPLPVLENLNPMQIARFEEQNFNSALLDLEVQPLRFYPHGTTAAHVLGQLTKDDTSKEGEESFYNYRLPDFRGLVGIEAAFDSKLRGKAGAKSVLVNNLGYRQNETIWTPVEPGQNVVLTIDFQIQQAAERSMARLGPSGANTRGAVVVMDCRNGDILALVSLPAFNPNQFVEGMPRDEWQRLNDPKLRPQINRATQENYAPGSIFKVITGIASLENGLNPEQKFYNPGETHVGRRAIKDLAPPGDYDFRRALLKSSNSYFIDNGIKSGIANILRVARQFHLGERSGLPTRQEVSGILPTDKRIRAGWTDGDTANLCIGQGELAVTPLQMTVMAAAVANGGKVFRPRLVQRVEPQNNVMTAKAEIFSAAEVRTELNVKSRTLKIVRDAMLADTEDSEGTGYTAFHESDGKTPRLKNFRVCGKTGTAQVMNERNQTIDHTTWFASFAPYEEPRYAMVVMVESGGSGGGTCAPIARDIYLAIQKQEQQPSGKTETLARAE